MTTHDEQFGRKVAGYLDQGTAAMRAGTAYRLQLARARALERLTEPERASDLQLAGAMAGATGGSVGAGGWRGLWTSGRLWIGIALIAAAGFGYQEYQSWRTQQDAGELLEMDAAILTSDVPLDAYLDRGFQNWLKHLDDQQ